MTQQNTPQPVEVTMGDPAGTLLTYRVTNTSTGSNVNDAIYRMRFTAPAGYIFTGAVALPAGWAVTSTGQTIDLRTGNNPCTSCLLSGGSYQDFTLTLGAIPSLASDAVSTASILATFIRPTGQSKTVTKSGQLFVTLRALKAVLIAYLPTQCTPDCTNWGSTCNPSPSTGVGGTHNLTMIIQNMSTSTWSGIISNPSPPTATYTWSGAGPTFSAPASITLAPGACGVLTWTVTMPAGKSGFVSYQARARNSTGAATSKPATSATVTVASPVSAIGQTCVFPGETATVTMTVTNNGTIALSNVKPWGLSTTLAGNHTATITTITVASTAGFPAPSGTLLIESEEVNYTGTTGTTFTGCTRGANGTTAASHSGGTATSCPRLTNVAVTTTLTGNIDSVTNTIAVAATTGFPASLSTIVIDSEAIRYAFTGATAFNACTRGDLQTTAASHLNGALVTGSAVATYLTGPTPASVATLNPGASTAFTWTYRIDGTGGQVSAFQGFSSVNNGALKSLVATSPSSSLGLFDVGIASGATLGLGTFNDETTWNIANYGCLPANRVDIQIPAGFTVPSNGFDSDAGSPPDWSATSAGGIVSFTAGTTLAVGTQANFTILYSGVPQLTGPYAFPVTVTDTSGRKPVIPTSVTVDTSLPPGNTDNAWDEPTR